MESRLVTVRAAGVVVCCCSEFVADAGVIRPDDRDRDGEEDPVWGDIVRVAVAFCGLVAVELVRVKWLPGCRLSGGTKPPTPLPGARTSTATGGVVRSERSACDEGCGRDACGCDVRRWGRGEAAVRAAVELARLMSTSCGGTGGGTGGDCALTIGEYGGGATNASS